MHINHLIEAFLKHVSIKNVYEMPVIDDSYT